MSMIIYPIKVPVSHTHKKNKVPYNLAKQIIIFITCPDATIQLLREL